MTEGQPKWTAALFIGAAVLLFLLGLTIELLSGSFP